MDKSIFTQDGKILHFDDCRPHLSITTKRFGNFSLNCDDWEKIREKIGWLMLITKAKAYMQLLPLHDAKAIRFYDYPLPGINKVKGDALIIARKDPLQVLSLIHCSHITLAGQIIEQALIFNLWLKTKQDFSKLKAIIYSGICQSCYQVGPEIAERFDDDYDCFFTNGQGDRLQMDLAGIIRYKLTNLSLKNENIQTMDTCSCHQVFTDPVHGISSDPLLFSLREREEKERNLIFCHENNAILSGTTGNCPYVVLYQ